MSTKPLIISILSLYSAIRSPLDALDTIEKAEEMDIVGLYFHGLKGQRKGEYSVRVTGNRRVTWRMDGNDVIDLNLEDYH